MSNFDPAKAKYVSLVTFRKNGVEVPTPVWIAPYDDCHYVFSEADAGKMKRLKNDSRIKIALCDVRGRILNDTWLTGTAEVIAEASLLAKVYASFANKYGLIMHLTNALSKLSGRYDKRAMIQITLTKA